MICFAKNATARRRGAKDAGERIHKRPMNADGSWAQETKSMSDAHTGGPLIYQNDEEIKIFNKF